MKRIEKLTLIKGEFTGDDAREILVSIFKAKIDFHRLKNFSSHERFGVDDEIAKKRIPALEVELKKLLEILSEAKAVEKKLVVKSEINISFSDH